jgi:hypothetical protein
MKMKIQVTNEAKENCGIYEIEDSAIMEHVKGTMKSAPSFVKAVNLACFEAHKAGFMGGFYGSIAE